MKIVEQVSNCQIVYDEDIKLTPKQLTRFFEEFGLVRINDGVRELLFNGNRINILVKNVTYLGSPHPDYKKRIQIPGKWKQYLNKVNTILCGIYSGPTEPFVVVFANLNFVQNKLNQSSAHVFTNDIVRANQNGVSSKVDSRGNYILVLSLSEFKKYLNAFSQSLESFSNLSDVYSWQRQYGIEKEELLINICSKYGKNIIGKRWFGVDAYKEMVESNYNNAFQSEWPGFYNEFNFGRFLQINNHQSLIELHGDWASDLDLDCRFNLKSTCFYGDIKTHTVGGDLIGNDKSAWDNALRLGKRIWLIVVDHYTSMDKDHNWVVRDFWNQIKLSANRGNPNSSYTRMKFSVDIFGLYIFEINSYNSKYLSDFNQGKQQSGQSRNVKYLIKKRDFDNFLIFRNSLS